MSTVRRDLLQTFSGQIIDIDSPNPDTIRIEDIARGLANIKRFSGQTDCTVAAHCIKASLEAEQLGFGPRRQLYALLHDAAEAYYGDMPSPIKRKMKTYKTYENKLLNVILEKYLNETKLAKMPAWLKTIDDNRLTEERDLFFNRSAQRIIAKLLPYKTNIQWRCIFMNRFNDLYRQIYLEGGPHVRHEKLND